MRVAMLAPPWIPVPPPELRRNGAGGGLLGGALTRVATTSRSSRRRARARRQTCCRRSRAASGRDPAGDLRVRPRRSRRSRPSTRRAVTGPSTSCTTTRGFVAFAFANRLATPLVHTLHAPFTDDTFAFYTRHGRKAQASWDQPLPGRDGAARLRMVASSTTPSSSTTSRSRGEGRLCAVGRAHERRQRPPARDRRRARGGRAARARRARPAGPGGVLRRARSSHTSTATR